MGFAHLYTATRDAVIAKPRATAPASKTTSTPNEAQLKMTATENYGKLPLSFERNQGQSDEAVEFLSRSKGYTLFLTPTQASVFAA